MKNLQGDKCLVARSISEENRTATSLELFYDLIFVVAIANLASAFHHDVTNNHISHGLINFSIVFMSIWWAWNQYTWFASSFDNDGVRFRMATLWQMVGALVLAAGVKTAFNGDFTVIVIGYVIIRSSAIWLWFKVSTDIPKLKTTGRRYVIGIFLCQVGWVTQSFFESSYIVFIALFLCEFFVPFYAESHTQSHYHPEHIQERHGLLAIIVLGESILASTNSFIALIKHFSYDVLFVSIGCILTLFGIWWLYFNNSVEHKLRDKHTAFQWGYGHVIIFAAAAAIGALVSVNVDVLTNHGSISLSVANLGFAFAVALYLIGVWFCQERLLAPNRVQQLVMPSVALGVIVLGLLPFTIATTGLLIVATVVYRQYNPLSPQ